MPRNEGEEPYHSEVNIEDIRPAVELSGHAWVGKGTNYLVCSSCPYQHAMILKPNQMFHGIDDEGYPIIKSV